MPERKDWPALLSPCGNARKYFKDATGGAAWVDKMCDGILEVLTEKQLPQGVPEGDLDLINRLLGDPLTRKIHIHRNSDMRWEVSVDFKDIGSWSVAVDVTIRGAIEKLYNQERTIRTKYGMKQLGVLDAS